MSDSFGSDVIVYRADGQSIDADENAWVQVAANSLQFTHRDRIGPFDHMDLQFNRAMALGGVEGINISLTRYWWGEDEDGDSPEALMARDAPIARQFAEELEKLLGEDYTVEWSCDEW